MITTRNLAAVPALALLLAVAIAGPAPGKVQSQSGAAGSEQLAAPPQQLTLPTNGTWNQLTWVSGPNVDATPTFDVTGPAVIDVTDIQITGDQFEVFDGATSLGQTSAPTEPDGGATGGWTTAKCDSAFNNPLPNYSKGTFSVGAGVHTITVRNIRIPTNPTTFSGGDGCIRAVPLAPDLLVSSLTHDPLNPTSNDAIQFDATVKNVGNQAAGVSTLMFAIGGETPGSQTTLFEVPALNPGATATVTRIVNNLDAQNYLNTAVADFNNDVAESNEANNTTTDSYTVTAAAEPTGVVYSITDLPDNGTLFDSAGTEITTPGQSIPDVMVTYEPDPGFEGTDMFTYRCTDSTDPLLFDEATVDIIVSSPGSGDDLMIDIAGAGAGDVAVDVGGSIVAVCTSDCTVSVGAGNFVKLQARPVGLDVFGSWGVDCSGTSQIFTFTMPSGGATCSATFNNP